MRTTTAVVVLAAALTGCSSSTTNDAPGAKIDLTNNAVDLDAMTVDGWMNPKTLQIHASTVAPEDGDMVIRGAIRGWRFEPYGDVEGGLHPVPDRATPDACWLVLSDRTVVYREGGTEPGEPCLEGVFDAESGLFYPSSTVVHGR